MEDERGLKILKEMCPSIYGDGTKVRTCCSTAQLVNMEGQMQIPYTVSDTQFLNFRKSEFFAKKLLGAQFQAIKFYGAVYEGVSIFRHSKF